MLPIELTPNQRNALNLLFMMIVMVIVAYLLVIILNNTQQQALKCTGPDCYHSFIVFNNHKYDRAGLVVEASPNHYFTGQYVMQTNIPSFRGLEIWRLNVSVDLPFVFTPANKQKTKFNAWQREH